MGFGQEDSPVKSVSNPAKIFIKDDLPEPETPVTQLNTPSGILTFKNAAELRETFSKIPLDRIVIETDAPYCAPVPYRGQKCEPAMVVETARVLAEIKGVSMDELSEQLAKNVKNLYPKIEF